MKKHLIKILLTTIAAAGFSIFGCKALTAHADSISWKLHTTTALHQTDNNWQLVMGDYNNDGKQDLYAICKSGSTGSGKTEIHVLNGADNFKSYLLHTSINIPLDNNWEFQLGDYNKDGKPDLYAIFKSPTGNRNSEIHILDGADNFNHFLLQKTIPLIQTNSNWYFRVADGDKDGSPDLYAIQTAGTGSGKTEVHALSSSSSFQNFFIHAASALGTLGSNWDFQLNDFDGNSTPDLYAICKNGTGSKSTEVHVLNGSNNFGNFLLQTGTPLSEVSNDQCNFALAGGKLNLYCLMKNGTGSKTTEVHYMGYPDEAPASNPLDAKRQRIIDEAKNYLGVPYVWGGTTPSGFDCSGLAQYVYKHALGINLPRTTTDQVHSGIEVSASDLKPGDLIFPHSGHVQIYIGNGQVIHAPHTGDVVRVASLGKVWHARRIIY